MGGATLFGRQTAGSATICRSLSGARQLPYLHWMQTIDGKETAPPRTNLVNARTLTPKALHSTASMKSRCLSTNASVVPFLYPSVSRVTEIAPMGFSKSGKAAPSRDEQLLRPRAVSSSPSLRITDHLVDFSRASCEPLPSSPSRWPSHFPRSMRR